MPTKMCKHCRSIINSNDTICPFCRRKQGMSNAAVILIVLASVMGFFIMCILFITALMSSPVTTTSTTTIAKTELETTVTPSIHKPEELTLTVGDKIASEDMEVTINKIEFSYDVVPDNTSSFYTHYEADDGDVYIHIDADVKNLSKQNLRCDDILSVKADYDDGYSYKGQAIVEDDATGFTYAILSSIDPLKTQGVHFIISCPEEVEESDKPLFLTIKLSGTSDIYKYTIR